MHLRLLAVPVAAALALATGILLAARDLTHGSAAPAPVAASPAPSAGASVPPPATPSARAATPQPSASGIAAAVPCGAAQLDVAAAAETGRQGEDQVLAVLANHSARACRVAGGLAVRLLGGGSGGLVPAGAEGTATGQAWLVPDRVVLDPWEPQPGEATVLLSWPAAGAEGGACSGAGTPVAGLGIAVAGGSVTAPLITAPAFPGGMAVCGGQLQVGPLTQVSSVRAFTGYAQQAADFEVEQEEGASVSAGCAPDQASRCLRRGGSTLGRDAATFEYELYGPGAATSCAAYVYLDGAGWHPLQAVCGATAAPADGASVAVSVPGGGCAPVRAGPGHASRTLSCLGASATARYTVEGAPVYVAETDPASGLPMGTIWWYLAQPGGWVAQDWLGGAAG